MASVKLRLFVDVTNRHLVLGQRNTGRFTLPSYFQEDKISLEIMLLELNPSGGTANPYSVVSPSGISLVASVGFLSPTRSVLAQQTSWSVDVAQQILTGALDLNTSPMVTAFTSEATVSIAPVLELEIGDASGTVTAAQETIAIKKELYLSGTPSELPIASYPTIDQMTALFVKFFGNSAGQSITLTSPDGTHNVEIYVDNDGTFHADPSQ